MKNQIKTMSIWRKIIVCLMAAMLLLTFAACGSEPAQQDPQTVAVEGKSEEQLRQQLTNGDVTEIIIQGTLYLSAPVEVVGNKTITGDGKIVAQGDWAEDAYLIRVASGTELVLAGTVTVDGKGISGGVYVSEGATLQVTEEATVRGAAEAYANVLAEGAVQISGGFLSDSQGDNVRVTGTLEQNGGTISGGYNNVSVAEGASFVWNAGSNLNAKNDGVLIAEGAELKVTAATAILKDAGAQGIHLEGKATIDGILITGCQENQIKIEESAELVVNECTLSGSYGHGITNRGKLTMNAGDITGAVSCGIVNTGVLEVNGGGIRTNGNKGILVKNGGSLVIASENVAISGNVVGVAVEENATADISKAKINSNTLNNISCFGELYIHDILMGGSGSNCIATNYGGHVVAKNMEIISTNGNNGIYNINGSLVELTDCTISGTKTNAIRNLDADLVATNLTISNCAGGISTGDYIFGKAGSIKIDGLTVSGVTGNNVATEAYCGGTIELTNAKLGATGSNNLSIKGGHLILTDVTVEGNSQNSQGTTHGILMDEGGKITAKNVTISNTKYSAIRNRGGYFEGTNITLTKIGQDGISNASHGTTQAPGIVIIRNLTTSYIGERNIDHNSKGGLVSITGGYLCQTSGNNIRNVNGTTVLNKVTMGGTVAKWSDYLYGFMITGGTVKAKDVEVGPCYAAAIRTKGGDFEGTNITTKGGLWFAWNGGGNITIDGLTTENVTENNLKNDVDDATTTITNGKLCATGNNNVRIYKGVVTLKDTDVAGQTADAANATHGVLMTGGELKVDNVTIHDAVASGIRNRGGKVTGSNLTLKNIGESGISATKEGDQPCTVVLDKLVTENVGSESVTADAGTVTLTNATLGSSGNNNVSIKGAELVMTDSKILGTKKTTNSNIHGIMVTKGSAKLENIQVQDVDAAALRVSGGEVTAANITANGGTWGAWISGGTATVDGLTVDGVSGENLNVDGGVITVSNAKLGASPSNSVTVKGGTVNLSKSQILGTTSANAHGVFVTKGKVYITDVTIDGVHSGLRTKDAAEVLEATNVTMTNLRDCGVSQSAGAVTLNNVTVDAPANYGIFMDNGSIDLKDVTINAPQKKNGISVAGGSVTGKNVVLEGVTGYGVFIDKNAGDVSIDGLKVNASGSAAANVNISAEQAAYTGTVTLKNAVLGKSQNNNVVLKAANAKMILNNVEIQGTKGVSAHAVYVTAGTINGEKLTITDSQAALRVNGAKAVVDVKDSTLAGVRDNGVTLSNGAVTLTNVTIDSPTNYGATVSGGTIALNSVTINAPQNKDGISVSGGAASLNGVTVNTPKSNGITVTGGTVTGKDVVVEGVTAYGVFIDKNAGDVSIDGLKVNASGSAVANVNISAEQADYTGTVTLKNAVLGKSQNNNVVLKAANAKMILNNVEIQGTKGGGAHGVYITAGTINGEKLTITDSQAALRVNGAKAVVDVKDSTFVGVRDNGVTLSNGAVTLTNVTIDSPTNYGATVSGGTIALNSVTINAPQNKDGISVSGGAASLNGVTVNTPKSNGITVTGGTVTGKNVVIEGVTAYGINVGKSAGDISITGLSINAPDASGNQSAQATTNLQVENGYAKTITLSGTAEADAVLGKTATNNIRTYSGTLALNHVDIMGTAKDNAICTTASGAVTASDLEVYGAKAAALRFKDSSSFSGTDVLIANCATGANLHGTGTHSITGLNITGSTGNNILLESGFTGTLTVNGTAEKSAYLGTSASHSIRLYGGTINLNYVEIAGTSVNAIHGILSDKTTITATNLNIHDTKGSGLRLRDNTTFTGTNVTISNVGGDGISHASQKLEITGLKITSAGGYGIYNDAAITIKGSNNAISGCGNLAVLNNANKTITVEGGTITGNVGNDGTMTMNASVTGAVTNSGSLTQSGAVTGSITNSGSLTQNAAVTGNVVNSGEFTVGAVSIKGDITNSGTLTATGTAVTGNVSNSSTLTMTNVTVNGAVSNTSALTISKVYIRDGLYSTTAVTFTGSEAAHTAADPMLLTIPEGNIVSGTVLVVFDNDTAAAALSETFTVPQEYEEKIETSVYHDSVLEVSGKVLRLYKDTNTYVAQVNGGNKYMTLAEAIAYAVTVSDAQNPATVVLLENIDLGSTLTVPAGANVIITDNGSAKTILRDVAGSWSATDGGVMIDVEAGATLTLQGTGTDTLILDGNKTNVAAVADVDWAIVRADGTVYIGSGTVLQNNKNALVNAADEAYGGGGAIHLQSDAKLYVTGGKFLNNEATSRAGAIFAENNSYVNVQNAVFEGNSAGDKGGAICTNNSAELYVKNCTFTNNTATSHGGAIQTYAKATVIDSTFTGNSSKTYGGAYNVGSTGEPVKISGCTFTSNSSTNNGGAVNGSGSVVVEISGCKFEKNTSVVNGGAVSMAKGTITGSTFSQNEAAQGGAINSSASSAANLVVSNCSITGNKAKNGGGINAATGCNITLDGCTVTGNDGTDSDPQGENIRLAGNAGASKIVVKATSQSAILDVHMQAASYVTVSGSLKDGSQIILNWPIYGSDNRVPVNGTAVKFDSAEIAKNNFKYFALSSALSQNYHLALDGDKITVKEGGAVARVDGVVYGTLEEAIAVAAAASTADKAVTVELMADVVVTKTITIPENANIVITDDGMARTITRGTNFDTKARGVLFDVSAGAKVRVTSTGDDSAPKLIFDGNNTNIVAENGNWAIFVTAGSTSSLTIEDGVKFMNNSSTGAGGVLRIQAGTLTISGGVFSGNKVINNSAGVINIMSGAVANISNATFTSNSATGNGGVIAVVNGGQATIKNCVFDHNHAGQSGGVLDVASKTKGHVVVEDCTFSNNSAAVKGGTVNLATDCIISIKDSTFTNNSAPAEGNDIRLGGATSKVYLSGKVVAQIHNQNASTVHVEGALAADSLVVCNWLVSDANRIPAVAVQFDSADALAASWKYIRLSDSVSASYHLEVANEKTLVLVEGAEVARVEGIGYDSLDKAVAAAATSSIATGKAVTVQVVKNVEVGATIAIPANANIVITDDGTARSISRSSGFNTSRGVMFDVINANSSLTLTSTSGSNNDCRLIIDGANQSFYSGNCEIAVVRADAELIINAGVKLCNNYSGGDGGAIRAEAGSTLTINGGVFTGNNAIERSGGVINVISSAEATISNATFTNNFATANGGAIVVYDGAKASITNCEFKQNTAGSGGAIYTAVTSTADCVVTDCTITGNTADNGGGVYAPGAGYITLDGCTVTGNTSTNGQGADVQIAASDNTAHLVVKSTNKACSMNVYFRNRSTMDVEGNLAEGSMITCYWYVTNFSANANGHTAVTFDSAEALAANRKYISLSAGNNSSYHFENSDNALLLKAGAEIAKVGDVIYTSLADAITAAGNASSATNAVTVQILNNIELSATVAIPANANIIITDDGTARTIKRSASWGKTTRGVLFDVNSGANVVFISTGSDANPKLIIDGNNANAVPTNANWAVIDMLTSSNVTINSGVKFANNTTTRAGAVIRVDATGNNLIINGGVFENNGNVTQNDGGKYPGGVINVKTGNTVTVKNATFRNNFAVSTGGVVHFEGAQAGGNPYVFENCVFESNRADGNGGVIYATACNVSVTNCSFTSNKGKNSGAIHVPSGSSAVVNGGSFTKNSATAGYGGAISAWGGNLEVSNASFTENSVTEAGGAILSYDGGGLKLTNCQFTQNTAAKQGGALATWSATAGEITGCTFTSNSAVIGGAIHLNENSTNGITVTNSTFNQNKSTGTGNDDGGGAVYVKKGASATITGSSFTENTASKNGGAVYVQNGASATVTGGSFTKNTVTKLGGAIYTTGTLTVTGTQSSPVIFDGNYAGDSDGAISVQSSGSATVSYAEFKNNGSKSYGGAIGGWNSGIIGVSNSYFESNSCGNAGGAVLTYNSATVTLTSCGFNQNQAGNAGGALAAWQGTTTATDCTFTNNSATTKGGAIDADSSSTMTIAGTYTFSGNTANGAANDITVSKGTLSGITVENGLVVAPVATTGLDDLEGENSTSTEDTTTEGGSTEETSTEDTSTEDTSTEDTSTEDTSTEDTTTEGTSPEDTSTEDTSTETTTTESTPSEPAEPAPETESTPE